MAAQVLHGDVFERLADGSVPPGSIDCAVTSPPYWMLRSYLPANHPLRRFELGSEPTVAEYIANQVRVFELVKVALADHGTCWINVGDSYSHDNRGGETGGKHLNYHGNAAMSESRKVKTPGVPEGNLCLVPQRLMIALQDAGWIVRTVVIWHKPAPMPSSVRGWSWERCRVKRSSGAKSNGKQGQHPSRTAASINANTKDGAGAKWADCPGCKKCEPHGGLRLRRGSWRPTSSYEPVIMLAKTPNYFADGVPVETEVKESTKGRAKQRGGNPIWNLDKQRDFPGTSQTFDIKAMSGRATANLRDVWKIAAEPLKEAHYAAFPSKLVDTILRCSTSAHGYCVSCNAPWVRIIETEQVKRSRQNDKTDRHEQGGGVNSCGNTVAGTASKTVGWRASCECGITDTRPGKVLDPFGGSGRTARAAQAIGLDSVSIELNPEYAEMARRLIRDDSPLFATV